MTIKLNVPKDKIQFIRDIEGRKFKDGVWEFPDSSLTKLQKLGLIYSDVVIEEKKIKEFDLSSFLFKHQKQVVNNALNNGSYGIFADTGTGKTIMGLEIAKHHKKTLVICPLSIIETAWIDDCHKFYPDKKIVSLWDKSKKNRIKALNELADIYIINFEGVRLIFNELLLAGFDCMIIDESSKLKDQKSIISQLTLKLSEKIQNKFVMSGCPTPNHKDEIFTQMKIVNPEVFGNNFHGFKAKYFTQDMANPHKWYQTDENKDAYNNRLSTQSIFINKDDCLDLPEKTFILRKFNLHNDQRKYYDDMLNDIKNNINIWSKFEFTAKLMKLRQIVSGFVIDKSENINTFKTNKDTELADILNELGDNQVIVWCQFIHEIDKLSNKFGGVGLTSKTPNRDKIINDFKNGNIKRLYAHPKLIGKGLTFTNCKYNIYYSLSFSYEEFKQSQDRIHRIGQNEKCTYIILQGNNTIDENIYNCLLDKKSAVDELYLQLGLVTT